LAYSTTIAWPDSDQRATFDSRRAAPRGLQDLFIPFKELLGES
jgi:hypothetical protein